MTRRSHIGVRLAVLTFTLIGCKSPQPPTTEPPTTWAKHIANISMLLGAGGECNALEGRLATYHRTYPSQIDGLFPEERDAPRKSPRDEVADILCGRLPWPDTLCETDDDCRHQLLVSDVGY